MGCEKMNRREQIISTAARVFREKGFSNTSLREIAEGVGIRKPSLYYFYESKDDLLLEVIRLPLEVATERVRQIVESDLDPREKLRRAVLDMATSFDLHPDQVAVLLREENLDSLAPHVRKYIVDGKRYYGSLWEQIIAEGMQKAVFRRDVDPRVAAYGALEMVRGMAKWYKRDGRLSSQQIGEAYAEMLVNALTVGSLSHVGEIDRPEFLRTRS